MRWDEPKEDLSSPSQTPAKHGGGHRLRIADLLLITLGTAVALWIMQVSGRTEPRHVFPTVVFAPFYGAAIAAVAIAAIRTPDDPFATQPGHWLLLLTGSVFLSVGLMSRGSEALTEALPAGAIAAVLVVAGIVLLFFSIGVFLYMLIAYNDLLHWRRVFRLLGATLILPVLGGCCLAPLDSGHPQWLFVVLALCVTFGPPLLLLIATIGAVIEDFRRGAPRDFWHWLGIAAFIGAPAHLLVTLLIEASVL